MGGEREGTGRMVMVVVNKRHLHRLLGARPNDNPWRIDYGEIMSVYTVERRRLTGRTRRNYVPDMYAARSPSKATDPRSPPVYCDKWRRGSSASDSRSSPLTFNSIFNSLIRSTLLSRLNKLGLKCPSVRPSVHKKFLRFQWHLACR